MAKGAGQKLGTLYFDLGLNDDQFAKDWAKTKAKYGKEVKMDLGINSSGFVKGTNTANSAQRNLDSQMRLTNKTMMSQRMLGMQLSNQFGTLFSIYAVERFIGKLAEVTGMFELQHASMNAILQDKVAGDKIFGQIKSLSVESPFRFKDLISYTKQLAAFSIPTNELYVTMKNLADVSAGLGVDMGRITLAFGQVKAASVLRGQELRQFTEAGIPLVAELAKKFTELEGRTVSAGEVFTKISKRMVSFGMVKDIFDDMTSAGGKFYKMQEVQAATLAGKISNLADAFDIALAKIGGNDGGLLKGGVDMLTNLTYHWEGVVKAVVASIAVIGTYKTAMIFATAATKGWTAAELIQFNVTKALTAAQIFLNKVIVKNPYVAISVILVALVGAMWAFHDATTAQEKAQIKLNELNKKAAEQKEALSGKINKLVTVINSETSAVWEQVKAYNELQKVAPKITGGKTLGQFKAQGSDSQQYAISIFESEADVASKVQVYKDAISKLSSLKMPPIFQVDWKTFSVVNSQEVEKRYKSQLLLVGLMKQELDSIKQAKDEANFLLLPEKTRLDILHGRQKLLLAEKERLTENRNLVMETTDGLSGWGLNADPFEFRLKSINLELEKTGLMLRDVKPPDSELTAKEKIEKQIKAYQELIDAMSVADAKKSPLKDKIRDLQELLKAYDIPNIAKQQKSADDKAADSLKARIKLIEEAYAWYVKLIEAQGFTVDNAPTSVKSMAKSTVKADSRYSNVNVNDNGVQSNLLGLLNSKSAKSNGAQVLAVVDEINQKVSDANMQKVVDNKVMLQKIYDDNEGFLKKMADENAKYSKEIGILGMGSEAGKEATFKHSEAVNAIEEEYAKRSQEYKDLMLWIADMSIAEVQSEMQSLMATLKSGHASSPEQQAAWHQMYLELEKKYNELVANKAKADKDTSYKDFKKTVTALNNVQSAVDDLIGAFDNMDAGVKATLTAISATATGTIKILEGISAASAAGIGAAEKASVILTVISAAIQILAAITKAFSDAEKDRQAEIQKSTEEYLTMLNVLRDINAELRDSSTMNIFGDDKWAKGKTAVIDMGASLKDFGDIMDSIITKSVNLWSKGGGPDLMSIMPLFDKAGAAMLNMNKADFEKTANTYFSDLTRVFKDFDYAAAKALSASGELSKESQVYVDGLISAYEDYKTAITEMSDYLSGVFGSVGSSIMDSITENMGSVKDAVDDMTGYVSDALWQMVEDIAYSKYFATIFGSIQNEILAAMGDANPDDATQSADIFAKYMASLGTATEDANAYMTTLKDYLAAAGFDVTAFDKTSSPTSLKSNIENIKEDTATKLAGYIAGIAQNSVAGRYQMAMITSALTEDGIMIKSEGLMQEVRENIGAMRANSDLMTRVMGRFDSCIFSAPNGTAIRVG